MWGQWLELNKEGKPKRVELSQLWLLLKLLDTKRRTKNLLNLQYKLWSSSLTCHVKNPSHSNSKCTVATLEVKFWTQSSSSTFSDISSVGFLSSKVQSTYLLFNNFSNCFPTFSTDLTINYIKIGHQVLARKFV